jgi:hypothetical protein
MPEPGRWLLFMTTVENIRNAVMNPVTFRVFFILSGFSEYRFIMHPKEKDTAIAMA